MIIGLYKICWANVKDWVNLKDSNISLGKLKNGQLLAVVKQPTVGRLKKKIFFFKFCFIKLSYVFCLF